MRTASTWRSMVGTQEYMHMHMQHAHMCMCMRGGGAEKWAFGAGWWGQ